MEEHIDNLPKETTRHLADYSSNYVVVMLLTQRGVDFQSGGGYARQDSKKVDWEADANTGDIVIYDGNSKHGVESIDINESIQLEKLEGRLFAISTPYLLSSK